MLYINQNDYPDMHYEHNVDNGGVAPEKQNIKTAGCGLCSLTMVVNHLTAKDFSLENCIEAAYKSGANRVHGSRMRWLAPPVAEEYGLDYKMTTSIDEAIECIRDGGEAIALVKGDREGKEGLFTHIGHYVVLIAYDGEEFCILDPGITEGKFDEAVKEGKLRLSYPFLWCKKEIIKEEEDNTVAAYYLFKRKKTH